MRRGILQAAIVVVAIAAAVWLWLWSAAKEDEQGLHGGPLFSFTAAEVTALDIRRPDAVFTIERHGDGWRLTGPIDDLVDAVRFEAVLADMISKDGQAVLPGTEPDERRFGFGAEQSIEFVFHLAGGGRHRLALGGANAVSGLIYASGAGRPGVFSVGGGLYAEAVRLPDSVRLPQLLPPLSPADLDSLQLHRRDDSSLPFARLDDGRWWLRLPGGTASLTGKAARYHGQYDDRRRDLDGATWLLADVRRLRNLVFGGTATDVVAFPAAGQDQEAAMASAGLVPPYRGVTFFASGGTAWRLSLGEEFEQSGRMMVAARREDAMVIARGEALHPFEGPVSEFLDLGALSFRPESADSLWIDEPDRPLLWGAKAADPQQRRRDLESIWNAIVPAGWTATFGLAGTADHLSDMQTHFDRLTARAVLAPVAVDPLESDQRWRVRAAMPDGRRPEVWLGRLAADGRPAVWEPRDGKVVVIEEEILVSLRNLRGDLQRQ